MFVFSYDCKSYFSFLWCLASHWQKFDFFPEFIKCIYLSHIYVLQGFEQQAGASDDFQEVGSEEKAPLKKKVSMDAAMEDKICDLYDLYVDVLTDTSNFL